MRGARLIILPLAAILTLAIVPARAADYTPPPPPCYDIALIQMGRAPPGAVPCYVPPPPPPPIEFAASWYLRGDIGFTNQRLKNMTNVQDVNNTVQNIGFGFDSSGLFGLGVGYYFNDWLRFDLTGEYRSRANFHGSQIITSGGTTYTDEYHYSKSEWLLLANGYIDLGTWGGFTPFIGAGVGTARVTIHGFTDINTPLAGVAFANDASQWNFAWAIHAGLAYKISRNVYAEFSYRYLDLGNAKSGDIYTYLGTNNINNPMEIKHLTSHDLRLGLRFNLDGCCEYRAPPVVYQPPPPQYYPPPQPYYPPPPPLRSKG